MSERRMSGGRRTEYRQVFDTRRFIPSRRIVLDRRVDLPERGKVDLDINMWLAANPGFTREQFNTLPAEDQMELRGEYKLDSHWHHRAKEAREQ